MIKKNKPISLRTTFHSAIAASALALPFNASAAGTTLAVGAASFSAPWVLLGLGALPALWWLMKSVPPKPEEVSFPAIRLLFDLQSEEQKPDEMPLWHRLLRTTAAAAVVVGLAMPNLNPDIPLEGDGSIALVVDNGWAAARNWPTRIAEMNTIVDRAEREGRPVIIIPTAPAEESDEIKTGEALNANEARGVLRELKPQPWSTDHDATLKAIEGSVIDGSSSVVFLSDGLDSKGVLPLVTELQKHGNLTVLKDLAKDQPHLLIPPQTGEDILSVTVRRADTTREDVVVLSASNEAGHVLKQVEAKFEVGQSEAKASFDVPVEVRNQMIRVSVDGDNGAGAVALLDDRWHRRPVGMIGDNVVSGDKSLLSESGYIHDALKPYVDFQAGSADDLVSKELAVMIMPDAAAVGDSTRTKIEKWVDNGGTLLRFAGPRLAAQEQSQDTLVPVPLRAGSRALGGTLSESKPGRIAPFDATSPFYGITLPKDITIDREVTAQPSADLDEHTWARLEDGSPLVTARQSGKGWIVLVHTTANREWSNLVLSGLFIDMMRAVVAHSQGVSGKSASPTVSLPPIKVLDGRGQLISPSSDVRALTRDAVVSGVISPQHPPGFYGNESIRQAHNLASGVHDLRPLAKLPEAVSVRPYDTGKGQYDLTGPILGSAMGLMLVDLLILLSQRGTLPAFRRGSGGFKRDKDINNAPGL